MTRSARLTLSAVAAVAAFAASPAMAQSSSELSEFVVNAKPALERQVVRSRILGGAPVGAGVRSFQVGLATTADLVDGDGESQYQAQFCGGTKIAPRFVLTAAHCVVEDSEDGSPFVVAPSSVTILHGDVDLYVAQRAEVTRIVVHPDYDNSTFDADIALIEVASDLAGDEILLADQGFDKTEAGPDTPAIVSGWGKLENDEWPYVLRETELTIQDTATCTEGLVALYSDQFSEVVQRAASRLAIPDNVAREAFDLMVKSAGQPIPPTMLCAGVASGSRDSCSGDSGGPLFVTSPIGPVQVGIISWGEVPLSADGPCGHRQLYGYYTRVSSFRDWVKAEMGL